MWTTIIHVNDSGAYFIAFNRREINQRLNYVSGERDSRPHYQVDVYRGTLNSALPFAFEQISRDITLR